MHWAAAALVSAAGSKQVHHARGWPPPQQCSSVSPRSAAHLRVEAERGQHGEFRASGPPRLIARGGARPPLRQRKWLELACGAGVRRDETRLVGRRRLWWSSRHCAGRSCSMKLHCQRAEGCAMGVVHAMSRHRRRQRLQRHRYRTWRRRQRRGKLGGPMPAARASLLLGGAKLPCPAAPGRWRGLQEPWGDDLHALVTHRALPQLRTILEGGGVVAEPRPVDVLARGRHRGRPRAEGRAPGRRCAPGAADGLRTLGNMPGAGCRALQHAAWWHAAAPQRSVPTTPAGHRMPAKVGSPGCCCVPQARPALLQVNLHHEGIAWGAGCPSRA